MGRRKKAGDRSSSGSFRAITKLGGWWHSDEGEAQPERRRHERVDYGARLRLVPCDKIVRECEAQNISVGGVLLRYAGARASLPVGQLVELELATPTGATLKLEGEIVRHESKDLFAVRFMNVTGPLRDTLATVVDAAAENVAHRWNTEYAFTKKSER